MATEMKTYTGLGNVYSGILGGLAGGTAVTNAHTNYVNVGWPSGTSTVIYNQGYNPASNYVDQRSILEWQVFQGGTYTVNTPAITAQWLGQIPGTVQLYGFGQIGGNIAPTMWVPQLTPEELKAMEVAEERRHIEREAAKAAATELLCSSLDREQLEQFKHDGHFDVKIADRVYRITPGRKVHALHEKKMPHLCIAPYGHELPNEDVALAQKLLLEANEKEFLKTAIRWAA